MHIHTQRILFIEIFRKIKCTCTRVWIGNPCPVMVESEEESELADWEAEPYNACLREWIPSIGRCRVRKCAGDHNDVAISDSAFFVLYYDEARDCNAAQGRDCEVQMQPFLAYVVVCKGFSPKAQLELIIHTYIHIPQRRVKWSD